MKGRLVTEEERVEKERKKEDVVVLRGDIKGVGGKERSVVMRTHLAH